MAMGAWQWCVGVAGKIYLSHPTTLCCGQVLGTSAWVGAGGRESGGGGDLGFAVDGVVGFAGPDGGRVPYDALGGL